MSDYGEMTSSQIEALLRTEVVARIGCQDADRPYVVPVTYAYDGTFVYGYSGDGRKLNLMTAHPFVCVEVDRVESTGGWQSVIAYGWFEKLADEAAYAALQLLSARLRVAMVGEPHTAETEQSFVTRRHGYGVAYRISLVEKSGRYERPAT